MDHVTYVGLDVHKNEHTVAVYAPGCREPEVFTVTNQVPEIRRMAKRLLERAGGPVVACYEAGVLGFSLKRQLDGLGLACRVIAPSLTPVRPGQRVQTDPRDARMLGEYLRAGLLTEVQAPDERQESVRGLCRWREAAQGALGQVRHQVLKFLLCRGMVYREGSHWTQRHQRWLSSLRFSEALDQEVFTEMRLEMEHRQEQVETLDRRMEEVAAEDPYRQPVGCLCCLRGFQTVTALSIVAELYGFQRFGTGRELMSYLGLTSSEMSSGLTERKGRITRAGNRRVRRLLVEAAWHQIRDPMTSKALAKRREGQPAWAVHVAQKAQSRLHRRYWRLVHAGKVPTKAVVAVARELAGVIWAMLRLKERAVPAEELAGEGAAQPAAAESRPTEAAVVEETNGKR